MRSRRVAGPTPFGKFEPEHGALIGVFGVVVAGGLAILMAVISLSKGHTIGAGLCMSASAIAFGLLAMASFRRLQ